MNILQVYVTRQSGESVSFPLTHRWWLLQPLLARKRWTGSTECFLLSPLGCSLPGSIAKTALMQSCSLRPVPHRLQERSMKAESLLLAKTLGFLGSVKPHSLSLHLPCEAQFLGQPFEAGHIPLHTHTHPELVLVEGTILQKGSPLTLQQVMKSKVTGALFQTAVRNQVRERGHRAS